MPIKICFILPSLQAGGAERVLSFLANNLSDNFITTLIIIGFEKDNVYDVSSTKVIYLNKPRLMKSIPALIFKLRAIKPDIVFSSIGHVNLVMALFSFFFFKSKFIGREASVISARKKLEKNKSKMPNFIVSFLYQNLDYIVCQSKDMLDDFIKLHGISNDKISVISNPMRDTPYKRKSFEDREVIHCITIGRLTEVKGHKRIISCLAKLNRSFSYTIIGDGPLKEDLREEINKYGLSDNVKFINHIENIYEYLVKNDVFLQGSFVEGFPNALLEALSVGLPALCFTAPGGTIEIIENGKNGFIAKGEIEFLNFLEKHKNSNWNPEEIVSGVHAKFNQEKILDEYEELLSTI